MTSQQRHTQEQIDRFLESQHTMRLATIDSKDGAPHVVPVWYLYEDGVFYVGTHTRTAKAKNIASTGRAGFCIDVGVHSPDIFGVAGHGRAELVTADVAKMATRILSRYYDTIYDPAAQELLADTDCIISITPDKMTSWSYSWAATQTTLFYPWQTAARPCLAGIPI